MRWMPQLLIVFFPLVIFAAEAVQKPASFEREVAPILIKRCLECHGDREPSGKLILSQRDSVLRGGESGPALVPNDTATSLLLARITSGEMPNSSPFIARCALA